MSKIRIGNLNSDPRLDGGPVEEAYNRNSKDRLRNRGYSDINRDGIDDRLQTTGYDTNRNGIDDGLEHGYSFKEKKEGQRKEGRKSLYGGYSSYNSGNRYDGDGFYNSNYGTRRVSDEDYDTGIASRDYDGNGIIDSRDDMIAQSGKWHPRVRYSHTTCIHAHVCTSMCTILATHFAFSCITLLFVIILQNLCQPTFFFRS